MRLFCVFEFKAGPLQVHWSVPTSLAILLGHSLLQTITEVPLSIVLVKMPAGSKLVHRFDRSKIAPLHGGSHLSAISRLAGRQDIGRPPSPTTPGPKPGPEVADVSSDEDDSDGQEEGDTSDDEVESEGEKDGAKSEDEAEEVDDDHNKNPFGSEAGARSGSPTISETASMTDNPFMPKSTVTGTATAQDRGTASTTLANSLPQVATNAASTSSSNPNLSAQSSKSPNTIAAIVIASILAAVSVVAIAYLLLRYCTPLKARLARYRGRKGDGLSEAEDGVTPRGMTETSNPGVVGAPSTITTPAPAYTRAAATTQPQAPVPPPKQTGSQAPENPFTDQASLSRSNSAGTMRSAGISRLSSRDGPPTIRLGEADNDNTYAVDFNLDGYAATAPRLSISERSHPGGLANNPPTVVVDDGNDDESERPHLRPTIPIPPRPGNPVPARLDTITPTPLAKFFPLPLPLPLRPDSVLESPRSQYQPRIRKSITPSESVSNAPYSPLPFPIELMPPVMPAAMINSRWSRNSSSINGRMTEAERSINGRMTEAAGGVNITGRTVDEVSGSRAVRTDTLRGMGSNRISGSSSSSRILPPLLPVTVKRSSSSSTVSSTSSRASRSSVSRSLPQR